MGRHSARPRRKRLSTEARWTVAVGFLGVVIAVAVLRATGVDERTSLLIGGGALIVGLLAFVLLHAAGLLTTTRRP